MVLVLQISYHHLKEYHYIRYDSQSNGKHSLNSNTQVWF